MSNALDPLDMINDLAKALNHGELPATLCSPEQVWRALLGEANSAAWVAENEGLGAVYTDFLPGGREYGNE